MLRHSGLQKDVLRLYRRALRVARAKDGPSSQKNYETVKTKFRQEAGEVSRKDFRTIEFMLRHGTRRIEELESADVSRVTVFKVKR